VESQLRAHGLTLGHFPQSFELSTIGGWVASRSSGQQSLRYGRIEKLFAGGTLELPDFPAFSAGPDLRELVLGSEGRLGIITEVKVRVSPLPQRERFQVVFFPNWAQGRDACRELAQQRVQLSMLRLSNAEETRTQLALAGHERAIRWLQQALALRGADTEKCMMTFGVTGSSVQCRSALLQARRRTAGTGAGYKRCA
jgi:alkyldihydroxyacetonephosphate synthase